MDAFTKATPTIPHDITISENIEEKDFSGYYLYLSNKHKEDEGRP